MPHTPITDHAQQVLGFVEAARNTIVAVPFFWVITAGRDGHVNARVVNAQAGDDDEDFWTRWFLTSRTGRKATEIREGGRVTLAYQHDSGNAYVAISGAAELVDERNAVDRRFRGSIHDDPEGKVAALLIAVKVKVDHLELHVRGITAEPWGRGRTLLDRRSDGTWNWDRS